MSSTVDPGHAAERERVKTRCRARSRTPGPIASLITALGIGGMLAVHYLEFPPDFGAQNAAIGSLAVLVAVALWLWFVFFSVYGRGSRRAVAIAPFALAALAVATVRFDQFTGDMVPTFRFAWRPPHDRVLDPPVVAPRDRPIPARDPTDAAPHDFPQFLGPSRDGTIVNTELADSWERLPEVVWRQPIGAGWSAFAVQGQVAVTMEQRGDDELVTAYEPLTGRLLWAHSVPARHESVMGGVGPRATPILAHGFVYALGGTGILRCLDLGTGALIWKQDVLALVGLSPREDQSVVAWGRANSPLVYGDTVVVPAGGPAGKTTSLIAFDRTNGAELWRAGNRQISYSSPILVESPAFGPRQIVVVNEDAVTGHDPETGRELWLVDWPGSSTMDANTSQPHIFRDSLVVTKGYPNGGLARFQFKDSVPARLYHDPRLFKTKLTSIVIEPGSSFAYGLSDGILECVDLLDGRREWKGGRYGHGQILLVNRMLLVLSERGELALVRATFEAFDERARMKVLHGNTWNTLCLSGTMLLVRNSEEAVALRLPLAKADRDASR
ncbi:MAG: hypothetical protein FJ297_05705 [Planctomycetes bacterium]|nr:hypothetical protein [Planctomycetota bacterium]